MAMFNSYVGLPWMVIAVTNDWRVLPSGHLGIAGTLTTFRATAGNPRGVLEVCWKWDGTLWLCQNSFENDLK